jgi:hypothetical protein
LLAALIALSIVVILVLAVYVPGRSRRALQQEHQRSLKAEKFDTTLGEFHHMREALRPLVHTRTASRRDPQSRR